ncbi:MAG: hypothetical protein ACIARQ_10275 [Phycisphaerales bacterium JB061]
MSQMGPTNRPEQPTAMGAQMVLCPYCGSLSTLAKQCNICSGHFDLLSRQRSQNAMGPWFIRDLSKPFQPGCSYATLVRMAQRGKIKPDTVLRGPSTRQFWSFARQTPGVANLLGECHACHKPVMPTSNSCPNCKASFLVPDDRQVLGLSPVHLLPGDADAETIARSLSGGQAQASAVSPPATPQATPQAQTPAPMSARESAPEPIDSAPVPEPQVIVEEPEWIDEDESESGTAGRLGVVIALLVFVVMMGGAGVWAWLHLSSRAEQSAQGDQSQAAAVTQAPVADEEASPTDVGGGVDVHSDVPPTRDEAGAGSEIGSETASGSGSGSGGGTVTPVVEADPEPEGEASESSPGERTPSREVSSERLAYDRILNGIAEGTLDEASFEAGLMDVRSDQRAELRRLWERRAAQVRLGRRGG